MDRQSKYTLPKITSVIYEDLSANSISLHFIGKFHYVNVIRNDGFFINNIHDAIYKDVDLQPNTEYYYTIIPFNNEDMSGNIFVSDNVYTFAIILNSYFRPIFLRCFR